MTRVNPVVKRCELYDNNVKAYGLCYILDLTEGKSMHTEDLRDAWSKIIIDFSHVMEYGDVYRDISTQLIDPRYTIHAGTANWELHLVNIPELVTKFLGLYCAVNDRIIEEFEVKKLIQ